MARIQRKVGLGVAGFLLLVVPFPAGLAFHEPCIPTQADPSTVNVLELPDGRVFYVEERGNPAATNPPAPGTGALLGGGTWWYEEGNGIGRYSLQRGSVSLTCNTLPPEPLPPVMTDCDPIMDESCGRGPDLLVVGVL